MASENNKFRCYAHLDGHTDVCYSQDGSHLLTCGSDGDVRIWKSSAYDEDAASHRAGDTILAVVCKNQRLYTAAEDNAVRISTFPECQADGIAVRFTAPVTHMAFSADNTQLYAGSEDFHIKIVTLDTSKQRVLLGHEAPVLCVAPNPGNTYLASSSCDGTVKIWKLEDDTCVKTLPLISKSNSFSSSATLCRMTWTQDGKMLAVPVNKEVRLYSSDTWEPASTLSDPSVQATISVCAMSPCGKYLVAGCTDGLILLWDIKTKKLVNKEENSEKGAVTGIAWKPQGDCDLAFTDKTGFLGIISDFIPLQPTKTTAEEVATDYADLFDDDIDFDASSEPKDRNTEDMESEPADTKGLFDDDDNDSKSVVSQSVAADDAASEAPKPELAPQPRPAPTTPLQPAFQPAAAPTHLNHRFMLWNSVGVIRQYNTEEENSIDVEFHDTATHHAMHVTNTLGHSMAALSDRAMVLACESDDDTPSQVVCTYFGAWDSSKEWSLAMPDGEEVEAVTLGDGWVAVATDRRQVRLLTVGGVQLQVFVLPGPVVCLAGHGPHLFAIYHRAQGLPGEQCLGAYVLKVDDACRRQSVHEMSLPLSPRSALIWAGFSAEGTPVMADSTGILYMLNRRLGNVWTQVANTKSLCKGKSDHYWIVGVHENPAQIRAIMCKGSRYPPTLPRPNVNILPYQLPLCEMSTDKGQLEESYLRSRLLSHHLDHWSAQGYEVDESAKTRAVMPQQEMLIKLFALACKTGREARAEEIAELMNGQQAVQLVIKYASRLRKMQLAEKLTDIARAKAEQEEAGEEEEDVEEVEAYQPAVIKRNIVRKRQQAKTQEDEEEEEEAEEEEEGTSQDMFEDEEESTTEESKTPVLKFGQKTLKPNSSLKASQGRSNPFKVQSQSSGTGLGSRVFDDMSPSRKNKRRPALPETTKSRGVLDAFKPTQKKVSTQSTLKKPVVESQENDETKASGGKTAFQLWMAANEESLQEEHPDVAASDLVLAAARAFKDLPPEEKKVWQQKAKGDADKVEDAAAATGEKRKRSDDDSASDIKTKKKVTLLPAVKRTTIEKKKPLSNTTNAKLSSFSFNK